MAIPRRTSGTHDVPEMCFEVKGAINLIFFRFSNSASIAVADKLRLAIKNLDLHLREIVFFSLIALPEFSGLIATILPFQDFPQYRLRLPPASSRSFFPRNSGLVRFPGLGA